MKRISAIFTLAMFLIIPNSAFASLPEVKVYYQHAERTTEYLIEKDDDLDYSFNKYYFKLEEDLNKKLSFVFDYVDYIKDFKTEDDLNSRVKNYGNRWDYYFFKDKEESLKLDFDLGYRESDYPDNEKMGFDRTQFGAQLSYSKEDVWRGAVKGGMSRYYFADNSAKDRRIYSERVSAKRYFYDGKLALVGSAKLKQTDYSHKNDKSEYEAEAGADIETGYDLLEKISIRGEVGEKNTVEDEEYDEDLDYDYTYTIAKLKTFHELSETVDTKLRGEWSKREYWDVDNSYGEFLAGNSWDWKYYIGEGKNKYFLTSIDLVHANTKYVEETDSSHYKNGGVLELAYKMRGRWSNAIRAGDTQYRYVKSGKNRDVYFISAELSRYFFDNKLELNFEYRYNIKDYLSHSRRNVYQHSFLVGGMYRF